MIMSVDDCSLAIRITSAPNQVAAIKSIRAVTRLSIADIKTAFTDRTPIKIANLYGIGHDENEQIAIKLFDELDNAGVGFEIILNGHMESRQYFHNSMSRWRQIGVHTRMMSDLESGDPCIETLEWLRSNGGQDVFLQTLRQIINGEGYNVDNQTLDWAKRELKDA